MIAESLWLMLLCAGGRFTYHVTWGREDGLEVGGRGERLRQQLVDMAISLSIPIVVPGQRGFLYRSMEM